MLGSRLLACQHMPGLQPLFLPTSSANPTYRPHTLRMYAGWVPAAERVALASSDVQKPSVRKMVLWPFDRPESKGQLKALTMRLAPDSVLVLGYRSTPYWQEVKLQQRMPVPGGGTRSFEDPPPAPFQAEQLSGASDASEWVHPGQEAAGNTTAATTATTDSSGSTANPATTNSDGATAGDSEALGPAAPAHSPVAGGLEGMVRNSTSRSVEDEDERTDTSSPTDPQAKPGSANIIQGPAETEWELMPYEMRSNVEGLSAEFSESYIHKDGKLRL